jgi:hypothetical protein
MPHGIEPRKRQRERHTDMLTTSSTSSTNVIPFPARGLPGQFDLFLLSSSPPTVPTDTHSLVGLAVRMLHRSCRWCGSVDFTITSSAAMHHAGVRCVSCLKHGGWLSKGAVVFLEMTVAKFGRPTSAIIVRHSSERQDS